MLLQKQISQTSRDCILMEACGLLQKYRRALDIITQESGLPESSILDLRGNHDAFDMGER